VTTGSTVVVVGVGAVGLCAIIAAKRLGAARIVAMSRHESRQQLAELPLSEVADAYQAMDERHAIKVLLRP
jgi:threonine dehydrogenase-like Zn-dependent dehydrogenase